jgi:hypothetical protein
MMEESKGNDAVVVYLKVRKNREISVPETGIEPWNCHISLQITNTRCYIATPIYLLT